MQRLFWSLVVCLFASGSHAANNDDIAKHWFERTAKVIVLNLRFGELIVERTEQPILKQYAEFAGSNHQKALELLIKRASLNDIELQNDIAEQVSNQEWLDEVIALHRPTSVKLAFRNIVSTNMQLTESIDWAAKSAKSKAMQGLTEKLRPLFVANVLIGRKLDNLVAQPDASKPLLGTKSN